MKTKHFVLPLLALSAGVLTASASGVSVASENDLILGFSNSSGTGSTLNLEIDLGQASNFYGVSGTEILGGLAEADLAATYGANWNTLSTLTWGVAGTTGSGAGTTIGGNSILKDTLWATRAETTVGLQSSAWIGGTTFGQQGAANKIANLYAASPVGLSGALATGNSATAAVIGTSAGGSWNTEVGTSAAAFTFLNPSNLFTNGTNATFGEVSDLYEVQPDSSAGVYLGSFGLTNAGVLEFSGSVSAAASTVPEPSTYAVMAGAVALGFVALRRRRQAKA